MTHLQLRVPSIAHLNYRVATLNAAIPLFLVSRRKRRAASGKQDWRPSMVGTKATDTGHKGAATAVAVAVALAQCRSRPHTARVEEIDILGAKHRLGVQPRAV